ncbi:MAG: type II secretion system F family protein [Candidatus Omnitrophica bacterium]|nr:type II secretion system F family protein [Candidatus Omnitrophota bacterium]
MATFRYKARDKSGEAVLATVEAESSSTVVDQLKRQGLQIVYLEEAASPVPGFLQLIIDKIRASTRSSETILFTRQLALMVRSGLPLVDSIEGIAEQKISPAFRDVITALSDDLRGGKSFSEALQNQPVFFSSFYVSMVRSGEATGTLEQVLERLADVGEEEQELKGKVISAMAYPLLLVTLAMGVVTYLLTAVLPRFFLIFEESGVVLPLPTRLLLGVSFLARIFWFFIPLVIGAVGYLLFRVSRSPEGQIRIHRAVLAIPFFGDLILKTIFARMFRVMHSLLRSGIAAVPALVVLEDLAGNRVISSAIARIRSAVVGGASLAEPFRSEKIFPATVSQLIAVGEKTGSLDETCRHLSDYYEREVARVLRTMTSVLEPLLLLAVGMLVAFIALSVLLPIFQLIRVYRR